MALIKTPVPINFAQGVDTKTDRKQVAMDHFEALENSVFDTLGQLTKRNGYGLNSTLPNTDQTTLTTLNDNLLATGSNLYAYSSNTNQWLNQGTVQPVALRTNSLVRSSTAQTSPDLALAPSGLALTTYVDNGVAYYQVSDSVTSQQIVPRTTLPATAKNPRAFLLGRYFIVTYAVTISGGTHLQYIAVPITTPTSPLTPVSITTTMSSLTAGYDAVMANDTLFVSWDGTTSVDTKYLTSTLLLSPSVTIPTSNGDIISLVADTSASTPVIWVIFSDTTANSTYVAAYNQILSPVLAKTQVLTAVDVEQTTGVASNQTLTMMYEVANTYSYAPSAKTDYVAKVTVTQAGTVGTPTTILRSVGLASKAFIGEDGGIYTLVSYGETNQPTYFLINSTGNIYMRLAYANGGGYASSFVLPTVSLMGSEHVVPYLFKDFLATVNKNADSAGAPAGTTVYTQTGVNIATFAINTTGQYSSEIAEALHLTGGQVWMYDAVRPVELGFHVWPENTTVTTAGTGGLITAGTYFYSFTYEWTDNKGNLHRSAPSIPVQIVTTGTTSANTLNVPTLRLTYKVSPNPVRIVGYRWSAAQQAYYQFTSITSPVINDTTVDSVTIVDTLADSAILGQTLLYTTGGVVENIAPPAARHSALFKNRYVIIDAENPYVLWFSKQVLQTTPVEMSDLFTIYIAPTSGAQGSTGEAQALGAMDDKLIIFKQDAIYYVVGTGPDNTGANNDFSDPTFITSSVGCANPNSIVLTPAGLMFQSDKGIWLLGRDLSTNYIGDAVEIYNDIRVVSALAIPGTNQVRFKLESGITLMYDYYQKQWGTFTNTPALSATLYNGLDTYLNRFGQVMQETPGQYLDGSSPVLLGFTTAWISLAGIQGLERFYFMYLLGTYITPFKLDVQLAYNFNKGTSQQITVTPDNFAEAWGDESVWGGAGPWGGPGNTFEARVFPQVQKCTSFQVSIREMYDPTMGQAAGAGLTLSGLNLIVGSKKPFRNQSSGKSFG